MSAEDIAKTLNAVRAGTGWMAPCPAHADRTPSLAIRQSRNGRALIHCFAGCNQASVIPELCKLGCWYTGSTSVPRASIPRSNWDHAGMDFNDMLRAGAREVTV